LVYRPIFSVNYSSSHVFRWFFFLASKKASQATPSKKISQATQLSWIDSSSGFLRKEEAFTHFYESISVSKEKSKESKQSRLQLFFYNLYAIWLSWIGLKKSRDFYNQPSLSFLLSLLSLFFIPSFFCFGINKRIRHPK
jgi:hypothetical protein